MKVGGDWLERAATQGVLRMLAQGGHRALIVGGAVRNAILGMPVIDIDVASEATPGRVMMLAQAVGFRVVPTGLDHGTVTVIADGLPHEVTTFRRDVETDGRHATVAFGMDLADDAARRDFTMNALYAEADGTVVDPLGGLPDALARRVRFVGEPQQRIAEDHLRILRFFRFHATHGDPGGGVDAEGLAACAAGADGIDRLSRERVGAEMRRLLAAPDPAPAVAAMAQAGVLARVLPGADPRGLSRLVHLEGDAPGGWLRRLSVLGGEGVGPRLRLSRAEDATLRTLREGIGTMRTPAELGYGFGSNVAADIVLARAALLEGHLPTDWQAESARGAAATFPVTAPDLMPAFSGKALGDRLAELETRWILSGFTLTKAQLLS